MKKFLTLMTLLIFGVSWSFAGADFDYVYDSATQSLILSKAENVSGDVVIPESAEYNGAYYPVTSIGENAFFWCSGMTSLIIGNSVSSIGAYAFGGCTGLISLTIPESVISIGFAAFYYCSGLTSVIIPDSVTSIGGSAFSGCSGLTSVTIPDSVTSIGEYTFSDCSSLTSVTIPDSVTSIGNYAFNGCTGLISLTIGNSVTSIGKNAFYCCSGLTSVAIPESVTSIGENAFSLCTALTSIEVNSGNQMYASLDGVLFNKDLTTLIQFPGGKGDDYIIPESVTSIGDNAFYYCEGLTSVTIPDSVTSIGYAAFYGCSALEYVYCLAENPPFCDADTFIECNEEAILYVQATSLDDYINASNDDNSGWSFFRDRIYSYTQLAEELIIDPTELVAYAGDSLTIMATVLPENATDKRLAWESSDENVAVVSQEGLVSILSNGECEITVRTVDGSDLSAVCRIMVRTTGIDGIDADGNSVYEVYSLNGVLIDPSADAEAIRSLAPGIYILRNEKGITKLIK